MELFLNFVWALLAVFIVCHWVRLAPRNCTDRRSQLIALGLLLVILFPVISVSDDLWSIQNPAETDTYQRRDHLVSSAHSQFPAVAVLPEPPFAGLTFDWRPLDTPLQLLSPVVENPALDPIQNRPPPAA